MGFIVKLDGDKYIEWSRVVDAPMSYIMSRKEMYNHLIEQREKTLASKESSEERLVRADKYGTSLIGKTSVEEIISFNRAGDNESCLSLEEIIEKYTKKK